MSFADIEKEKKTRAARRLCELFRGRFSEQVALKLIDDFEGELQAVDFLLNEDQAVVSRHLKQSTTYLEELRSDSQKVVDLLTNGGIEYEVRQFACGPCDRAWWKKVPHRKQVCKCERCHLKYDPLPHDKEWGWGKFVCTCSHVFNAFGEMGITLSQCYKCGIMVPIESVLPPRKDSGQKKSSNTHSCDAPNCYNRRSNERVVHEPKMNPYGWNVYTTKKPTVPSKSKVCMHPKSVRNGKRVRNESRRHVSTGSTVTTFLSQGSLDTKSIATLQSIAE